LRQLSNSLLSELNEAIKQLPGSTGAQHLLVTRVLEHLDRMAKDAQGDRQTQLDLVDAYTQLGRFKAILTFRISAIPPERLPVSIRLLPWPRHWPPRAPPTVPRIEKLFWLWATHKRFAAKYYLELRERRRPLSPCRQPPEPSID